MQHLMIVYTVVAMVLLGFWVDAGNAALTASDLINELEKGRME